MGINTSALLSLFVQISLQYITYNSLCEQKCPAIIWKGIELHVILQVLTIFSSTNEYTYMDNNCNVSGDIV